MRGGNLCELALPFDPDRHRVDSYRIAVQAGQEQLAPVLLLDVRAEVVGDLQPSLVVDSCGKVAPKHVSYSTLPHLTPPNSTESRRLLWVCQRQKASDQ